jgi:hypothetical protein
MAYYDMLLNFSFTSILSTPNSFLQLIMSDHILLAFSTSNFRAFRNLQCKGNDHKGLALLGTATVCWSIWLGRNELIFENKISLSPLQVIFTVAQRLRAWAVLQRQDSCNFLVMATQHLTQVAKEFFPGSMVGGLVFGLIATSVCF